MTISVDFQPRNAGHVLVRVTTDYQNDIFTVDPPQRDEYIHLASTAETITVFSGNHYAKIGYKYVSSCYQAYPQVLEGDLPVVLSQNGGPVEESIANKIMLYQIGALPHPTEEKE